MEMEQGKWNHYIPDEIRRNYKKFHEFRSLVLKEGMVEQERQKVNAPDQAHGTVKKESIPPVEQILGIRDQILRTVNEARREGSESNPGFMALVDAYMQTNKVSRAKAISAVAKDNPKAHEAWLATLKLGATGKSEGEENV